MRLDDSKHQALKLKTITDGVSIQGFVHELIEEYLKSDISAKNFLDKMKK